MYITDASIYSNDIELLIHKLQAQAKFEWFVQLNKGQKHFFLHSIDDDM